MITITGTIKNIVGGLRGGIRVEFVPTSTPFALDGSIITTTPKTVVTNSSGQLPTGDDAVVLVQGVYTVKIFKPNDVDFDSKTITVPPGTGSAALEDLITSTTTTGGNFNHNVSYDRNDAVGNGEYIGGRHRWNGSVFLKSATVVCRSAPVGAPLVLTLEVDGELTGETLTVAAGATTAEADLSNLQVPGGQYVCWKCTGAPSEPENFARQVFVSLNLNS